MAGNNTRVNILVEGQTEESFVRELLVPHMANLQVWLTPRIVETSKGHRGGATSFQKIVRQTNRWCLQDQTAIVTTMFDVYGLPRDFPGISDHGGSPNKVARTATMERTLADAVGCTNFIPYLQLHEYEALLFSDLDAFERYEVDPMHIDEWKKELGAFAGPEDLNDSPATAPSKRIIARWPTYERSKPLYGTLLAIDIGLQRIRQACPRFSNWVTILETL